jgi:adenylate cyclase
MHGRGRAGELMSGQRYRFGQWCLDCRRGTLTTAAGDIALRPKSFELLRVLIEKAGELISREDLLSAVWPGVTVTEESLTQCISELRRALGDGDQSIIKTVPKRGYLFALPVEGEQRRPTATSQQAFTGQRQREGPSIAVLPFANLSGDVSQDYLSDGISEDIINGLSGFAELPVIARHSSFRYKDRAVDMREVGDQLGVRYLVEGSVRRFGDRIRITARLVETGSGVQRWAGRFDRALDDIFAVQDELTRSVVAIVVAHLGKAEGERVSGKPPTSWSAYDLLMQGEQALRIYEQSWSPSELYRARGLFAAAHDADPGNSRICALLGHSYVRAYADPLARDLGDMATLRSGYDLVSRAVALDPNLPLARAQLGWALFWMHQPDDAVAEYEKAFALNPNFSDWRFPVVLVYAGAAARSLEVAQAHLQLDPYHPPHLHAFQGHALYMLKRYRDAVAPLRECIRRGPQVVLGHVWLAATLVRLGEPSEARALVAEVLRHAPMMAMSFKRWRAPWLYRDPDDAEHMIAALREAGL